MAEPNDVLGHAIHPDDWPTFLRLMADYKAGRFGRKPPPEDRKGGGRGGGRGIKVGIAKEDIPAGETGDVYFTRPGRAQGQEEKATTYKPMYSHYGLVREGARVLYCRTPGGWEIVQAPC